MTERAAVRFVPGLELAERFYWEAVRPLLDRNFRGVAHSAALLGPGSEVLGYDTPLSTDHDWGPRFQLFLSPDDHASYAAAIDRVLKEQLPGAFLGYSVNFSQPNAADGGTRGMEESAGPVNHLIEVTTPATFFRNWLGFDPFLGISPVDWLTIPEQRLLELTAGKVFHDGLGQIETLRAELSYFPHDVWLCRLAAQWNRISQEEHFMGRCGDLGDDLGSRIIAARLVRDLMKLCFLMERRYAPYSKWLGTAFTRLPNGRRLAPLLQQVLEAPDWKARQEPLTRAYVQAGEWHNRLGITPPVAPEITSFFNRPYRVIFAGRFAEAIRAAIADAELRDLPAIIGGVDQFVDCTDFTSNPWTARRSKRIYRIDED
jgi:hypothetical protein